MLQEHFTYDLATFKTLPPEILNGVFTLQPQSVLQVTKSVAYY